MCGAYAGKPYRSYSLRIYRFFRDETFAGFTLLIPMQIPKPDPGPQIPAHLDPDQPSPIEDDRPELFLARDHRVQF